MRVLQLVKYTRNGRAYFFRNAHLGSTAAAASMAALYAKTTKGWYFVDETPALIKGAASQSPHARTVILSMHQTRSSDVRTKNGGATAQPRSMFQQILCS